MTIKQMNLYSTAINKKDKQVFKNDVFFTLLGSRGSKEDIDKVFNPT